MQFKSNCIGDILEFSMQKSIGIKSAKLQISQSNPTSYNKTHDSEPHRIRLNTKNKNLTDRHRAISRCSTPGKWQGLTSTSIADRMWLGVRAGRRRGQSSLPLPRRTTIGSPPRSSGAFAPKPDTHHRFPIAGQRLSHLLSYNKRSCKGSGRSSAFPSGE